MESEVIKSYNKLRNLCLKNAEDSIHAAESLKDDRVNHIVFHLTILCLEELGKVFIGWHQLTSHEEWGKDSPNYSIEDHIKKLFWAIWGPAFSKNKFTKENIDEIRNVAGQIHSKRLATLYTGINDSLSGSEKISDEEVSKWLSLARNHLEFEKLNSELRASADPKKEAHISWFMKASEEPEKKGFIYSEASIVKLTEFGNGKEWIAWLKDHFESEDQRLKQLLKEELLKDNQRKSKTPKWKIRFKLITPSHSIRQNILTEFNNQCDFVKLNRGGNPHTLNVDLILFSHVKISHLYQNGWMISKALTGALNVGTNGIFYWNTIVDTDRYYDEIWDLENNSQLRATLAVDLKFDWSQKRLFLDSKSIAFTLAVFGYFMRLLNTPAFAPIDIYMVGLAMLSKTDVHLRMETQIFFQFFTSFRNALTLNQKLNDSADLKVEAFNQLSGVIKSRQSLDEMIDIGLTMVQNLPVKNNLTLTEVIMMRQYCDLYFLTLALRRVHGNDDLKLTTES